MAKLHQASTRGGQQTARQTKQPPMELMQKIKQLKDAHAKNPKDFDVNVELGNSYFDIGRYDKAISFYKTAIAVKPDQPPILIDLGVSYFNLQKSDSALFYMNQALKVQPDHPQGLYNLGIVYYNMGKRDKAIETWQRLIDAHPGSREAQAAKQFIEQVKNQQKSL
ncbi:MAG TPA: tetratricopeptide repeat protein [Caldithrix abyssi]|uniref:Tetratricopeptide repeat protein n=1 Tax=Caldithrix abyssi TaxID=187145 RepID=A0A7V5PP15_CALAY|nr:tetratricopeptide repeat protein [Caldithrix abyssi]